jgi:hypothetical protein
MASKNASTNVAIAREVNEDSKAAVMYDLRQVHRHLNQLVSRYEKDFNFPKDMSFEGDVDVIKAEIESIMKKVKEI